MVGPDRQTSEELSDLAVFEQIYPTLRRFAAVVADLDIDPDDLVQDALAAALRRNKLSDLDQPVAYLKRAMLNKVTDHRRKAGRFRAIAPRLRPDHATSDSYPSDLAILDSLDAEDRAIVFMADVEGLPHAVIAEQLGLKPTTVRKRVSRARSELRQLVQPSISLLSERQQ